MKLTTTPANEEDRVLDALADRLAERLAKLQDKAQRARRETAELPVRPEDIADAARRMRRANQGR